MSKKPSILLALGFGFILATILWVSPADARPTGCASECNCGSSCLQACDEVDGPSNCGLWGVCKTSPSCAPCIEGTNGNDTLCGASGNDCIDGFAGHDTLWGRGGNDDIDGGSGDDTLYGEGGMDDMYGGSGDDTLNGGTGFEDGCTGGSGSDTCTNCDDEISCEG